MKYTKARSRSSIWNFRFFPLQVDELTLLLAVYAGTNGAHGAHLDASLAASAISKWVLKG
jgi:hypothetical protein